MNSISASQKIPLVLNDCLIFSQIEPGQVASITDDQLYQLGLTTIGERIRFRDAARNIIGGL